MFWKNGSGCGGGVRSRNLEKVSPVEDNRITRAQSSGMDQYHFAAVE